MTGRAEIDTIAESAPVECRALLQRKVRVDLHSYNSDAVMIQDYAQQKTTIITPANSTDPNGSCTVSAALWVPASQPLAGRMLFARHTLTAESHENRYDMHMTLDHDTFHLHGRVRHLR